MLNRIEYTVTFPTGKTFGASADFTTGLTAITGPNESGKSLMLEMVRYALFGSKALRGKATDYKKLKLSLEFELRGETYRVERTGSNAKLFIGDDQVATGVKPVNLKIIALFGYNLDVFDVANACLQGEIEGLGSMRPTERKALVDRTIGLDAIDEASATAQDELTGARAQLQLLDQDIVVPPAPEKPEGYIPAAELREKLKAQRALRDEMVNLKAWLEANPLPPTPQQPKKPENLGDLVELEAAAEKYQRDVERLSEIEERINSTVKPELTLAQIEEASLAILEFKARQEDDRKRAAAPAPDYTEAELYNIENAQKAAEIRRQIEALRGQGEHECPACEFTWSDHDEQIHDLTLEIPLYEDIQLPEWWRDVDVRRERLAAERHERMLETLTGAPEVPEPEWTNAQLDRLRQQWVDYDALADLRIERRKLASATSEDPSEALKIARDFFSEELRWEREFEEHTQIALKIDEKTARLKEVEDQYEGEDAYNNLVPLLEAAAGYESQLQTYEREKAKFAEQEQRVKEKRAEVADLEAVRKSLRELKTKIKNHLLPSLNTVASVLLSRMTGGERNEIRVDEDFEILVDGQLLNTLSGSGKAVANLAIRLGLGQVLTNKTFSVFLADEIDASMDADRAGYTSECLSNLTSSIAQVVIVSHKPISASHHIELEKTHANDASRQGDGSQRAA